MKFRWTIIAPGQSWPLLRVGIRRDGGTVAVDTFLLVDTGADGTLLPLQMAKLLGYQADDLAEETSRTAAGLAPMHRPKNPGLVEIEIGGHWILLPSLKFGQHTPPLLGRDVLFTNFTLHMTADEIELRRLPPIKSPPKK
jgi:hypothetical protein